MNRKIPLRFVRKRCKFSPWILNFSSRLRRKYLNESICPSPVQKKSRREEEINFSSRSSRRKKNEKILPAIKRDLWKFSNNFCLFFLIHFHVIVGSRCSNGKISISAAHSKKVNFVCRVDFARCELWWRFYDDVNFGRDLISWWLEDNTTLFFCPPTWR